MNDQTYKDLSQELLAAPGAPETETIQVPDIAQAVAPVPEVKRQQYENCPICHHPYCTAWVNATPAERVIYTQELNRARYGSPFDPLWTTL